MPWCREPSLGTSLASGGTWQRTQGLCGLLDVCVGLCGLLDVCVGLCGLLDVCVVCVSLCKW